VGSGVVISPNGYIVTNNHVIEGAVDQGIQVTLYDKRQFEATVVGRDPSTDLAVLKIPVDNLSAITIGDSDQIEVGEWVLAVGNPFRLKSTVTAGIVSAMHRNVQIIDIENDLSVESFIQTDAAINKGNSGGALVNAQGRLIGINTAIASQSGSYQGYGFAVPVNLAIKVAEDLIEYGEVKRALLGIRMEAIDYDRSRQLGLEKVYGVEIMEILEGSSAAQSGLKLNDAILAIGDEIIEEPNELQQEIAERRPGDIIKLTLWRDQEKIEKKVRLKSLENTQKLLAGNQGESEDEQASSDSPHEKYESFELGLTVMSLPIPEDPREEELVITQVFRGSVAWEVGLRKGGVIKRVNGKKVNDIKLLERLIHRILEQQGKVTLFVAHENHTAQNYTLESKSNF